MSYDPLHHPFENAMLRRLKKHNLLHHYAEETRGSGVSSTLWDQIFRFDYKHK
jgi:hypothetical protein